MDYEITRTLVLSTGHIPDNEREAADKDALFKNDYGWMFYCGQHRDEDVEVMVPAPVLLSLKKLARRRGCEWLRLDADAQKRDDLPQFDW